MPKKDNPKPFIDFQNHGNNVYKPVLKKGGLNQEVINSGNLTVLKNFFDNKGSKLNQEEFEYLKARIISAEEIERLKKKALKDLAEGKEHPVQEVDNTDGFSGFSNLKYSELQTSSNGCWSCAYSLLLKSRGVDISQEKIRAWRPDYPESEEGATPAADNLCFMRNADTSMEIPHNVDMLSQLVPNTAMASLTLTPLVPDDIMLIDPKTNAPVEMTVAHITAIKEHHKNEVIKTLRETVTKAIEEDRSPVALVVDGHYITVTGIDKKGNLRYEDSRSDDGKTTHYMSLDELYRMGCEEHYKQVDAYTKVKVPPRGIALNWLKDLKVPEYSQGQISKPDYKGNEDVISVDLEGNVKVDVPLTDTYRTNIGNPAEGNITTKGVSNLSVMDTSALEKKLGCKVSSYGPNGGYSFGNMDIYYPTKVCAKNDPRLIADMSLEGDRQIRELADDLISISDKDSISKKPWAAELKQQAQNILLLTKKNVEPDDRKKAEDSLKALPAFLSQMDGEKSVLKRIFDDGYILAHTEYKAKMIGALNSLNDKLDLGMDIASAMGKPAGTRYTEGDARTDAEINTYRYLLDTEKIASGEVQRDSAVSSLAYIVALVQLQNSKYGDLHAFPPSYNEITVLKNQIENTAAMGEIRKTGVVKFLADCKTTAPEDIHSSFMKLNKAIYEKNLRTAAPASVKNGNAADDDFTLFGEDKKPEKTKQPETKKNTVLNNWLKGLDAQNRDRSPEAKGEAANKSEAIEGEVDPQNDLRKLRRLLTAGKDAKVSKKAYTDILKALDSYEKSFKTWKTISRNNASALTTVNDEGEVVVDTSFDREAERYEAVSDAIAAVQEKNKLLTETIDKYLAKANSKSGNDDYKLVLETAKTNAENARYYMDDRQMQTDLDHVSNMKQIDIERTRQKVISERSYLEEQMLDSGSEIERVFLFSKSDALFNISEVALNGGGNELSEYEKQLVAKSLGNLLFDKICQKFPDIRSKVNSPKNQEQYDEAVMDIITSASFTDLMKTIDRDGLRHILSERQGREDLFKNFIKEEYMTNDEISKLSAKKPAAVKDTAAKNAGAAVSAAQKPNIKK